MVADLWGGARGLGKVSTEDGLNSYGKLTGSVLSALMGNFRPQNSGDDNYPVKSALGSVRIKWVDTETGSRIVRVWLCIPDRVQIRLALLA